MRTMLQAGVVTGVLAVLLAGCGSDADAPQAPRADDSNFQADQSVWRMQRREKLVAPDGWASLIGLHWLELKSHFVGSAPRSGIRIAMGPPSLGLVQRDGARVTFTPERGVAVTLDGAPVKGRVDLQTDRDGAKPSVLAFDDGKGAMTVIERSGRMALRVRHADAPARLHFGALDWWPAREDWRIDGHFKAHEPGRTIGIANIIGSVDKVPNPGVVTFTRDGKPYTLEALDNGDGTLFLIFVDRTSGHESYGAGRYLDTGKPGADGTVVVDFNRAYNPPCAFTDFATCPLPPNANRLDLRVEAGEKRYLKPKP